MSSSNKKKHRIDFKEAQSLWEEVTLEIPVATSDEPRWIVIGLIGETHWTAVITKRKESVRIISVRRSRKEERRLYETQNEKD